MLVLTFFNLTIGHFELLLNYPRKRIRRILSYLRSSPINKKNKRDVIVDTIVKRFSHKQNFDQFQFVLSIFFSKCIVIERSIVTNYCDVHLENISTSGEKVFFKTGYLRFPLLSQDWVG